MPSFKIVIRETQTCHRDVTVIIDAPTEDEADAMAQEMNFDDENDDPDSDTEIKVSDWDDYQSEYETKSVARMEEAV